MSLYDELDDVNRRADTYAMDAWVGGPARWVGRPYDGALACGSGG